MWSHAPPGVHGVCSPRKLACSEVASGGFWGPKYAGNWQLLSVTNIINFGGRELLLGGGGGGEESHPLPPPSV